MRETERREREKKKRTEGERKKTGREKKIFVFDNVDFEIRQQKKNIYEYMCKKKRKREGKKLKEKCYFYKKK